MNPRVKELALRYRASPNSLSQTGLSVRLLMQFANHTRQVFSIGDTGFPFLMLNGKEFAQTSQFL